jgi:hypothetical protein
MLQNYVCSFSDLRIATTVHMTITVVWDMTPCSSVDRYQADGVAVQIIPMNLNFS